MSPVIRPAGIDQPEVVNESAIKTWLDALAGGSCDASAFLHAMHDRFSTDPEGNWEVLSLLDQYYRRGRIDAETFKTIKTALAESALGVGNGPAADIDTRAMPPARGAPVSRDIPPARGAPVSRDIPPARDTPARDIPVARDIVAPARIEQTDAHPRREETQSLDVVGEAKPGSVLRRRYRLEGVVAHGGTGTVFQAIDEYRLETPGSQRLAIKVLHAGVAKRAELLADLRREFQSLQLLSHPHIVRVFEFDRDGPLMFFTMELLNGALLGRVLHVRKLAHLGHPEALALIRDIGVAVAYAHSRGVVHGDLSPHNVFITTGGDLRVLSFGGAHKTSPHSTASDHEVNLAFAASGFASCQVLEGEHADARDDVFSLACIAYLLLSGQHPFASKRTAIQARDAGFKVQRAPNLSNQQWQALKAALAWEREERPADMQKWLRQLELKGAAKGLPLLTDLLEPPSGKERKPRLTAAVAAAIVLLLAAGYWISSRRNALPSIDFPKPAVAPAPVSDENNAPAVSAPSAVPPPAAADRSNPPALASSTTTPPAAPALRDAGARPASAAPAPAPQATPAPVPHAASPRSAAPPAAAPAPAAASPGASGGASKIELAEDTIEIPAGESSAQVTVHRKGNLRGETSFTWWTESGTAKPGADFSAAVPQLAHIGDGKSSVTLNIPVSNAPHAHAKSFYIVIDQSEGGAPLGARSLTMVTLLPGN
jgi:serine/threonine protein kinase